MTQPMYTNEDIQRLRTGYQSLAHTDPAGFLRLLVLHERYLFMLGHLEGAWEIVGSQQLTDAEFHQLAKRTRCPAAMWALRAGEVTSPRAFLDALPAGNLARLLTV